MEANHLFVRINNQLITQVNITKYLAMNLEVKLRWSEPIKMKQAELAMN